MFNRIGMVPSVRFWGYQYLKLRASRYPSHTPTSHTVRYEQAPTLQCALLCCGPLPFTSPRAAMVSYTDTPKNTLKKPSLLREFCN